MIFEIKLAVMVNQKFKGVQSSHQKTDEVHSEEVHVAVQHCNLRINQTKQIA